jgi:hypothetical protein
MRGIVLAPGETLTAQGRILLESAGAWELWPSGGSWDHVPVVQQTVEDGAGWVASHPLPDALAAVIVVLERRPAQPRHSPAWRSCGVWRGSGSPASVRTLPVPQRAETVRAAAPQNPRPVRRSIRRRSLRWVWDAGLCGRPHRGRPSRHARRAACRDAARPHSP